MKIGKVIDALVKMCPSIGDPRYDLGGVNITPTHLQVTDGHMLIEVEHHEDTGSETPFNVPMGLIKTAMKARGRVDVFHISTEGDRVDCSVKGQVISGKLLQKGFPLVERMYPEGTPFATEVTLGVALLQRVIDVAKKSKSETISFTVEDHKIPVVFKFWNVRGVIMPADKG